MSADPKNPKVGDRFVNDYSVEASDVVEVRFVDDDGSVLYRYVDDPDRRYVCTAEQFYSHFTPAPEPLITEPVTLWRFRPSAQTVGWASSGPFLSGDGTITILPDHTWIEGAP